MKEKVEAVREGKRILDRERKRNPDGKENAEDGDERARGFEPQYRLLHHLPAPGASLRSASVMRLAVTRMEGAPP